MTHSAYRDFAEHHHQIKALLKDYYKARLAGDLDTACAISSEMMNQTIALNMVTVQDALIAKIDRG